MRLCLPFFGFVGRIGSVRWIYISLNTFFCNCFWVGFSVWIRLCENTVKEGLARRRSSLGWPSWSQKPRWSLAHALEEIVVGVGEERRKTASSCLGRPYFCKKYFPKKFFVNFLGKPYICNFNSLNGHICKFSFKLKLNYT